MYYNETNSFLTEEGVVLCGGLLNVVADEPTAESYPCWGPKEMLPVIGCALEVIEESLPLMERCRLLCGMEGDLDTPTTTWWRPSELYAYPAPSSM